MGSGNKNRRLPRWSGGEQGQSAAVTNKEEKKQRRDASGWRQPHPFLSHESLIALARLGTVTSPSWRRRPPPPPWEPHYPQSPTTAYHHLKRHRFAPCLFSSLPRFRSAGQAGEAVAREYRADVQRGGGGKKKKKERKQTSQK